MMHNHKRAAAVLLAAGMLMSGTGVLPVPAMTVQAAEVVHSGTCGDNLTWTLDSEGTLTVSGTGNMTDFENNLDFPWSNYTFQTKKAVIEDGVTSIGDRAFYSCYMMTSVTIPESVTKIGFGAFDLCTGLQEVTIPESVSNIGNSAFFGCDDLTDITILNPDCVIYDDSEAISDNTVIHGYAGSTAQAYAKKYNRTFEVIGDAPEAAVIASGTCGENLTWTLDDAGTLTVSGTGNMTDYADASPAPWKEQKEKIKAAVIEPGVTGIGHSAFDGCKNLASVTIPEGVTSIADSAFYGCSGLTSVTIPDSVTAIERLAFQGCSGLTAISLPDGVTSIGNYAFYGCSGLTAFTVPESVTDIGQNAFAFCGKLAEITIPASVKTIGPCVFIDCTDLKTITLLNPDCEIDYSEYTRMVPKTTVIRGYEGSSAQTYADFFGQTFEPISASASLNGDPDGDGAVTNKDAQTVLVAYTESLGTGKVDLPEDALKAADVNGDGKVGVDDAQYILIYYTENTIAGKPTTWEDVIQ